MPIHLRAGVEVEPRRETPAVPVRLSRRDFLRGSAIAAVGAFATAGCKGRAGSNGNEAGWHAWLSDIHVAGDSRQTLRDENMADNLRRVVRDVLDADDPPRGFFVNGDLAFRDGRLEDYQTISTLFRPLRESKVPIHLTLGNHDDRSRVRDAFDDAFKDESSALLDKMVGEVFEPKLRYLLLDSLQKPNVTPGRLGREQIAWSAEALDQDRETPAVVFVHHNLNARWDSALLDTTELLNVLRPRGQVKAVVFGHTHVWNHRIVDGLHMINLPAVGYRFLPRQPLGWCLFRPRDDGGELQLRCIGGDRRRDGERVELRWRPT